MDWPQLIVASYLAQVARPWYDARELDDAPDVVLCHDRAADPRFVYANAAAAQLWERPVAGFLGWPSRLTAPPQAQAQRTRALGGGTAVVRGYSGLRVSASGRLFWIMDATLWPVCEPDGRVVGQAATFSTWSPA